MQFAASGNFMNILFHYDGRLNEWDEFEWSEEVIHITARKQTKWLVTSSENQFYNPDPHLLHH
jgi:Protein of unknown function (DUF707)